MEQHQAEQRDTLMEVTVEKDCLGPAQSRGSAAGCYKCVALAAVTGLVIVALAAGFLLYTHLLTPSSNKETTELRDALKVKAVCNLTQSDVYRCDIFTADKAASYVIDGWMKFSHVTNKDVTLLQTFREQEMVVQNVPVDKPDIFFFSRVKLVNGIRISIKSDHACTDSLFHIYELQRLP